MKRACIAIVDATRARIYTYEETSDDGGARVPPGGVLHEATDLFDPGRRGHDLFSTTKPGVKRVAPGGGSTDDHREAHLAELDRRFARQIIDEIDRIAREQGLERVVVVAGPAMQGVLRSAGDALERRQREVEYVTRDIAQLSSHDIHDHLAGLHVIAPRRVARAG